LKANALLGNMGKGKKDLATVGSVQRRIGKRREKIEKKERTDVLLKQEEKKRIRWTV